MDLQVLFRQAGLMQHRAEQSGTNLFLAVLQCREANAVVQASVASFAKTFVERHQNAAGSGHLSHFGFEFVPVHP
jgi:hypothetical protein